jgi:2-polyprenyl-3-methyl-5-hydroxy-6-metoxy-1,4-benzoquinol methylase
MQRAFDPDEPEMMDRPQPVSAELEADLLNLVSLNRLFGSHRLLRRFLAQWLKPGRSYRVLDLATGAGDLPRVMLEWARARDITLRIDAVDGNASTVEIARRHSAGFPEIAFQVADVFAYDSAETYDLVTCSLALHHFADDDAVRLLRRCRSLSHCYVLVSDLERSMATLAGVCALTALFYREPMTRNDARVSARRAFSFSEFRQLAERAAWKDFGHARFAFCRQAIWLDERDLGDIPLADEAVEAPLPCPAG